MGHLCYCVGKPLQAANQRADARESCGRSGRLEEYEVQQDSCQLSLRLLLLKLTLQFIGTKTSHACGAHALHRSWRAIRLQCERARARLLLRHFDDESRHVGDQGALHNCSSNVRQWRLDEKPRLCSLCLCQVPLPAVLFEFISLH